MGVGLAGIRAWVLLVAAAVVAGCGSPPTRQDLLEPQESARLAGRTVAVVRRPRPDFRVYTVKDGWLQTASPLLGLAGIWGTFGALEAAGQSRSDEFLDTYGLTDPALGVAARVGRHFGPGLGLRFAGMTDGPVETYDLQVMAGSLEGRADFALDLRTEFWGLSATPLMPKYRFGYRASLRLVDLAAGTAVASGTCRYWPEYREAVVLDDWTAANAALLRREIVTAVDACAAQLVAALSQWRNERRAR